MHSAAAPVAQPSPSRCSRNCRQIGVPGAGRGTGSRSRSGRASRMRPAMPVTDSCRARSWVAAGSTRAQAAAPSASVVNPSVRRASADPSSTTEAPTPARTAGQGAPSSRTSNAAKGRAMAAPNTPARRRCAQGVRNQARRASSRTSSATTARWRPELASRWTSPLAASSSSVSRDRPLRSPTARAVTSAACSAEVHTARARSANRPRSSSNQRQMRGPRPRTSITSALPSTAMPRAASCARRSRPPGFSRPGGTCT